MTNDVATWNSIVPMACRGADYISATKCREIRKLTVAENVTLVASFPKLWPTAGAQLRASEDPLSHFMSGVNCPRAFDMPGESPDRFRVSGRPSGTRWIPPAHDRSTVGTSSLVGGVRCTGRQNYLCRSATGNGGNDCHECRTRCLRRRAADE